MELNEELPIDDEWDEFPWDDVDRRFSSVDSDVCLRRFPNDNRGFGSYSKITIEFKF